MNQNVIIIFSKRCLLHDKLSTTTITRTTTAKTTKNAHRLYQHRPNAQKQDQNMYVIHKKRKCEFFSVYLYMVFRHGFKQYTYRNFSSFFFLHTYSTPNIFTHHSHFSSQLCRCAYQAYDEAYRMRGKNHA